MKFTIIDSLTPWIDPKNTPTNWSKAPFSIYENSKTIPTTSIIARFKKYIKKVQSIGYNAIALDDLAHMAILDFYSEKTKEKLKRFIPIYTSVIKLCQQNNMQVYVNTDIMFFSEEILKESKLKNKKIHSILESAIKHAFEQYNIDGIITRMGESDGIDVEGMFKSDIIIKKPNQANEYLKKLLPLFEKHNKQLIFRTWTIGFGSIGDLQWNKRTFAKTFKGITSDNLIISMKYGEADFFRNLKLNRLFFVQGHNKIIELQARREYEFFGEMPFYVGFDYEKYYHQLKDNKEMQGIMVWCQTGGWSKGKDITFLNNSSPYVELNTIATLKIFTGVSASQAVHDFFGNKKMNTFLDQYHKISDKILYPQIGDKKFKKIYLKKIRIPPTLWIYWNNITINSFMKTFVQLIYEEPPEINDSQLQKLHSLGIECDVKKIQYHIDTLRLLLHIRKALHGIMSITDIRREIQTYSRKYSQFSFNVHESEKSILLFYILKLVLRQKRNYRITDHLFLNKFVLKTIIRVYLMMNKKSLPHFVNNQAMPISKMLG